MPHRSNEQSSTSSVSSTPKRTSSSSGHLNATDHNGELPQTRSLEHRQHQVSAGQSLRNSNRSGSEPDYIDNEGISLPVFHSVSARRPNRDSHGFLLQLTPPRGSIPDKIEHDRPRVIESKGKEKPHTQDLNIEKRGAAGRARKLTPSAGSSPLAKELRDDSPTAIATTLWDETHPAGYGVDPAQIVSLALSLSENRRRYASASRLSPMGDFPPSSSSRSPSHHLQQPKRASKRVSPRLDLSGSNNKTAVKGDREITSAKTPTYESAIANTLAVTPSDATLARVQKTRTALELVYEYRRLLNYLPDISFPSKSRPDTLRAKNKRELGEINGLGRAYNPLQYIRNRRVRFRENKCLDSDHSEWKNVDIVRPWVDNVAEQRRAGISRVDDPFPLPEFVNSRNPTNENIKNHIDDGEDHNPRGQKKKRRWRMDWDFTPWDLLADAYWLQQDDNIAHIEDRRGERPFAQLDQNPSLPDRPSLEIDWSERRRSESRGRFSMSSFHPYLLSQQHQNHHTTSEQTNDNGDLSTPRKAASSRDRGRRWPRSMRRSASSSKSDDSMHTGCHSRSRRPVSGASEHAAFEKHMRDLLAQDADQERLSRIVSSNESEHEIRNSMDGSEPVRPRKDGPGSFSIDNVVQRLNKGIDNGSDALNGYKNIVGKPSMDTDLNSMAPNSPKNAVIDSRPSTLHESPQKSFPFHLGSFHHKKDRSRRNIDTHDFADGPKGVTKSHSDILQPAHSKSATIHSNLINGLEAPTDMSHDRLPHHRRLDVRSSDGNGSFDSRFRSLFRAGRIAEIVGNEVSKVGDMLSRKDSSNVTTGITSPASSEGSVVTSEEDPPPEATDNALHNQVSRIGMGPTRLDAPVKLSPTVGDFKPRGRNKDESLSPFQRSPERAEDVDDPIARQQHEQRERGRPARFDRLAPPGIKLIGVSPSSSRNTSLSRGNSKGLNSTRESSTSGSGSGVYEADRRLNEALGIPGHVGRPGPPITGLAKIINDDTDSKERKALAGQDYFSAFSHKAQIFGNLEGKVTKQDVARVVVTLLSSGVKANELVRRAHEVSDKPLPILQVLQNMSKQPLPRVPRAQEHLLAARVLTSRVDAAHNELRDAAEAFAAMQVPGYHADIKTLSEQINGKHSLASREHADQAEAVSTQLTTTMTLAIKQLNDSIDVILRRRRRKTRWLRRGGSLLLEWTLLAIMWWLWLVVVIIKLVRVILYGLLAVVKWLFWS